MNAGAVTAHAVAAAEAHAPPDRPVPMRPTATYADRAPAPAGGLLHRRARLATLAPVAGGLVLALAQTWAAVRAQSMNADGVSYLDIADRYAAGDWSAAVNAVWSPLYSWILAAAMRLAGARVPELVLVHATNFLIFVLALAAFFRLHRELTAEIETPGPHGPHPLPHWAWAAIPSLLFLYVALTMLSLWSVTPDMLMAGLVCLAAALIVRIRRGEDTVRTWAVLGLVLGTAYLSKSVMLPLGFAFLGAALLAARGPARPWRAALAAAVFLGVSAPWIAAVSRDQGHLTFGEAGRLTYLRYVNGIPHPYWYGGTDALGAPTHPPRLVLADPPVHAFDAPADGTYPLSFDPAHWYQGATPDVNFKEQTRAVLAGAVFSYDLFIGALGVPVACILLLHATSRGGRRSRRERLRRFALVVPAAAAFALYSLVYIENRYVGIFAMLALLEGVAALRSTKQRDRLALAASVLMCSMLVIGLIVFHGRGLVELRQNVAAADASAAPARTSEVARALASAGLAAGDPVGVIGYAFDAFWARAARVRLVAELRGEDAGRTWVDRQVHDDVLAAFAAAGARAVVAEHVPAGAVTVDWQRVGTSSTYLRVLGEENAP